MTRVGTSLANFEFGPAALGSHVRERNVGLFMSFRGDVLQGVKVHKNSWEFGFLAESSSAVMTSYIFLQLLALIAAGTGDGFSPTVVILSTNYRQVAGSPLRSAAITWVLEQDVFPNDPLRTAAETSNGQHIVVDWNDAWWERPVLPTTLKEPIVFHGDLGNADRVANNAVWTPGAYCNTQDLHCSAWYPAAQQWLLHQTWILTTVAELVENTDYVLKELPPTESIFVRPDSPLKPFSGRVLLRDEISLRKLDHGFYYDDDQLPIIVAPVVPVDEREWRFVVVDSTVVTGSAYQADGRTAIDDAETSGAEEAWEFAQMIASELPPPDAVYVLDVCESNNKLWLLELNSFSGADLYGCDGERVLNAVAALQLH